MDTMKDICEMYLKEEKYFRNRIIQLESEKKILVNKYDVEILNMKEEIDDLNNDHKSEIENY